MKKKHVEVTADAVLAALTSGATSLTAVSKALGFKGSVSSSTASAIRGCVPDVEKRLAVNKAAKSDADDAAKPKAAGKKTANAPRAATSVPARHPANPYRAGSLYATLVDCMATPNAQANGISREKLTAMAAAFLNREPRLVAFGVTVVCSPKDASPTCERHRSAREGYGIEKKNAWVRLVLPPPKP